MKKTLLFKYFLFSLCSLSFGLSSSPEKKPLFSYAHKTEVAYNNEPGFALNPIIENFAFTFNKHLNQSIFFDTSFIANTKKVREYHLKPKHYQENVGTLLNVKTKEGQLINCTFFDRNSDKLLVVGPGFTNPREYMSPFIDMFPDHDIVLFDFRGHGYKEFSLYNVESWPMNLLEVVPGVNIAPDEVTLGREEDKDVAALIKAFKKRKSYAAVHGLGVCYGAFVFLKAAALYNDLFDKLVLDGCWLSLPLFVEKVRKDFKTIWNPQVGGWGCHWLFGNQKFISILEWFTVNVIGLELHNLSLVDYLSKVQKTKVLFFYGKDDLMVHRHEFEQLWSLLDHVEKTVIITSNPHVRNHWKQKELFKLVSDLFFALDQQKFINCLQNPDYLAQYQTRSLFNTFNLNTNTI